MACGLPVITTKHSGLPEQVGNGAAGIIVPEGDIQALAQAIIDMINNPNQRSVLGIAGRKTVENKYDSRLLIDKQVRIYEDVIQGK